MSLGLFEKYEQAQRAVDYLSDQEFPVQNCMIVGTELKQVERVTGRLTYARAAMAAAVRCLDGPVHRPDLSVLRHRQCVGIVIAGRFRRALRRDGPRRFRGHPRPARLHLGSRMVATRYEVLVEHKLLEQAQLLLLKMPADRPL